MLAALLMAASMYSEPPSPAIPAAPPPSVADELKPGERRIKIICRDEAPTGTRFAKRKCMAFDDFQRQQELTSAALKEMQRNHNITWPCQIPGEACK